jgi:iron-sulfur cluster repair protein YtfE (RIC family)
VDVTDALLAEHAVFYLLIEQLDDAVGRHETVEALKAAAEPLAISLIGHAQVEERLVFGPLEERIGLQGPLACLKDEHASMDERIRGLFRIGDVAELKTAIRDVLATARGHFSKEEQVLFPVARKVFGVADRAHLGENWAQARGVRVLG